MSIVPFTALSASELTRLGNNVGAPKRRRRRRRLLAPVNRSLARIGEAVSKLHCQPLAQLWAQRAAAPVTCPCRQ